MSEVDKNLVGLVKLLGAGAVDQEAMTALRWDDIDLDAGRLRVNHTFGPSASS
jgi:hypothetical protein